MFTFEEKEKIREYYEAVQKRIKEKHINCFKGHEKPVFLISDTYPGVWLEHAYDSLFYAKLDGKYLDIAKNTLNLFLDKQKENIEAEIAKLQAALTAGVEAQLREREKEENIDFYGKLNGLSNEELLAIILKTGTKNVSVKPRSVFTVSIEIKS